MIEFFIVTLNEEVNIAGCIDSIKSVGGEKITILDGGSVDLTRDIAMQKGCKVVTLPESSISFRRGRAINIAQSEYICFVDADQRLIPTGEGLTKTIIKYFENESCLAGVQFSLSANEGCIGYWAKGFAKRHEMITGQPGLRKVVGTPCVFRQSLVKQIGYDESLTGPSDDTLFCSKLIEGGFILRAITEKASELVRASFSGTLRKAFWYGCGDAEYIRFNKKTRSSHLFHVLIRGPIIFPIRVALEKATMVPFFLIFGFARVAGFFYGYITVNDLTKTSS